MAGRRIGLLRGCIAVILVSVILFVGYKNIGATGKMNQSGLEVRKDGQVMLYIVDSFDKGYYDIEELKKMVQEEADAYNDKSRSGGVESVTVEEVSRVNGQEDKVRVVYRFRDAEAYSGFQGETLYYETLEQAITSRHIFSGAVLYGADGEITLDEENREKLKGKHVIVTEARTRICLPKEALYCSDGVRVLPDGIADTSGCDSPAVMLLKN